MECQQNNAAVGSAEENNRCDDGYIPPQLAPHVSHLAPHVSQLAPASAIVDSNMILDVVKKNAYLLNLLLENFNCAQSNGVADHASGRPVWRTNNDPLATVGTIHSHLNVSMETNMREILHDRPSGSDLIYDFVVNDNNALVCTTPPEEDCGLNAVDIDTIFQDDDDLEIFDDDISLFVESLKSTIQ